MNEEPTEQNRLFRLGDRIRLITWRGRAPFNLDFDEDLEPGRTGLVHENESKHNCAINVILDNDPTSSYCVPICNLELLQAAENQPYQITQKSGSFDLHTAKHELIASFRWFPASQDRVSIYDAHTAAFAALLALTKRAEELNELEEKPQNTPEP